MFFVPERSVYGSLKQPCYSPLNPTLFLIFVDKSGCYSSVNVGEVFFFFINLLIAPCVLSSFEL